MLMQYKKKANASMLFYLFEKLRSKTNIMPFLYNQLFFVTIFPSKIVISTSTSLILLIFLKYHHLKLNASFPVSIVPFIFFKGSIRRI
jgi:hypothetical protein